MRTRLVEERIGEFLGPLDLEFDITKHMGAGTNSDYVRDGWERIKEMSASPDGWWYGDFTRFKVVYIGMYDGWPYWRPTPAIGYIGPLGHVEWEFFYGLDQFNTGRRQ